MSERQSICAEFSVFGACGARIPRRIDRFAVSRFLRRSIAHRVLLPLSRIHGFSFSLRIIVQIRAMSVAGVSGNEEDQDVINLLRDLAHFLLNSSTRPIDYTVGHELFLTLLLAMRRGYIETERFPEITANVISYYCILPSSYPRGTRFDALNESSKWIAEIFDDSDDRLRDMRAITEVIGIVLGINEVESTINSKVSSEVSEIVMEVGV